MSTLIPHRSIPRNRHRASALLVLLLFILAQASLWLHQQDSAQHLHGGQCQICLHANAASPGPISLPATLLHDDLQQILLPVSNGQPGLFTTARHYPTRAPPIPC